MLSPLSSPEKMDCSEDSSFGDLPVFPRASTTRGDTRRRVSCPPQIPAGIRRSHSDVTWDKPHSPSTLVLDSIENNFNFLQLESPPNRIAALSNTDYDPRSTWSRDAAFSASHFSPFTPRTNISKQPLSQTGFLSERPSGPGVTTPSSTVRPSGPWVTTPSSTVRLRPSAFSQSRPAAAAVKADSQELKAGTDDTDLLCFAAPEDTMACLSDHEEDLDRDESQQSPIKSANFTNKSTSRTCSIGRCLRNLFMFCLFALLIVLALVSFGAYLDHSEKACSGTLLDFNVLESELRNQVYGQHIAIDSVMDSLKHFLLPTSENNVLVLSFHGWTGVGKNYVAGKVSHFLRPVAHTVMFIIPLHFPHENEAELHSQQMHDWIVGNASDHCGVTVFILDEMDKASPPLISGLKKALLRLNSASKHDAANSERGGHVSDLNLADNEDNDFNFIGQKTIFLLLSNTGGSVINQIALEHFLSNRPRETMQRDLIVDLLLVNRFGGNPQQFNWCQDLNADHLVTLFIPFLPLNADHVEQCVRNHVAERDLALNDEKIQEVVRGFDYFPQDNPVFVKSGCKRVLDLTTLVVE